MISNTVDWSERRVDSSKMLSHFLRAMIIRRSGFVLREKRSVGDPTGACAEEAPRPPAESEAPGAEINNLVYEIKNLEG
ncbi:hypothetical protein D1B31_08185 [Neobacillus notoginsengisoli]|uniref:Uncharacterized protein n=1 Tax=Neobacillus notoginsengisoli TaxID=1578198 RepID=A0A417YW96_9BACI|nr:hypothetical protein D1B31_08185 [Neobacillus notoginsengisoli]